MRDTAFWTNSAIGLSVTKPQQLTILAPRPAALTATAGLLQHIVPASSVIVLSSFCTRPRSRVSRECQTVALVTPLPIVLSKSCLVVCQNVLRTSDVVMGATSRASRIPVVRKHLAL